MQPLRILVKVLAFWLPVCSASGQSIFELLLQSKPIVTEDNMSSWFRGDTSGGQFPTLGEIPATSFRCSDATAPGFYADPETRCQVFRRCDTRGVMSSFLCANGTLFNQLTLTCDWWYNIDCAKAKSFYDFANSKLYVDSNTPLFDTPSNNNQVVPASDVRHVESDKPTKSGIKNGNNTPVKRKVKHRTTTTTVASDFF